MTPSRLQGNRRRSEVGSLSPFVLLLCLCLAGLLGLVAEGGIVLSVRETAVAEAEQAARAGAAVLTPAALRGGRITSAGSEAVEVAENVMALSGHPGTATDLRGVVTATVLPFRVSAPLLGLAGVSSISVSATASATAVDG
ncbi:MAG TPA: hypothetical protein VEH29_08665 [Acidimicrobiales bacterium]|nr:hypothetical protein [Acidimicrobiales bacterium]